jgi:cation transport ATPase
MRHVGASIERMQSESDTLRQAGRTVMILAVDGTLAAAGVLYPAMGLLLSPLIAALAMRFSSVSVIGNALRLRRVQL